MALKTVRRSRQLPCIAFSIEASSFLISSQRSDWRLVRGEMFSPQAFSRFVLDDWGELPAAPFSLLAEWGSFDRATGVLALDDIFSGLDFWG